MSNLSEKSRVPVGWLISGIATAVVLGIAIGAAHLRLEYAERRVNEIADSKDAEAAVHHQHDIRITRLEDKFSDIDKKLDRIDFKLDRMTQPVRSAGGK